MHYTELFDNGSDLYAQARPTYSRALYSFLLEQCEARENAWDCACGNGQTAVDLVEYFKHVDATDVSPNQIASAFKHPRITYSICSSEQTTFESDRFDLICVAQALHWMQFDRFWHEAKRVLKPNGIFAAWGYSWVQLDPEIDALIQRYLLNIIEPYWAEQNKLLWNHYRDVSLPFETVEAPEFVMKAEWTLGQLMAYFHTWSSSRRCMDSMGDRFFNELYHQLASVWGNIEQSKTVNFDFCCLVGRNKT